MRLKINRLKLKNYRSFREFEFVPSPYGITYIVGPNGSGKSTIIEAINLAVSGHIRDRKNLINMEAQAEEGRTESFIELDVMDQDEGAVYTIKRVLAPSGSHLLADGSQVIMRNQGEIEQWVFERIGYPPELFCEIACCEQWEIFRILEVQDSKRDRMLSNLLGLDHIEERRKKLFSVAKEKSSWIDYEAMIASLEEKLKELDEEIRQKRAREAELKEKLEALESSVDRSELDRLQKEVGGLDYAIRHISLIRELSEKAQLIRDATRDLDEETISDLEQIVRTIIQLHQHSLVEHGLRTTLSYLEEERKTLSDSLESRELEDPVRAIEEIDREIERVQKELSLEDLRRQAEETGICPVCGSGILSRKTTLVIDPSYLDELRDTRRKLERLVEISQQTGEIEKQLASMVGQSEELNRTIASRNLGNFANRIFRLLDSGVQAERLVASAEAIRQLRSISGDLLSLTGNEEQIREKKKEIEEKIRKIREQVIQVEELKRSIDLLNHTLAYLDSERKKVEEEIRKNREKAREQEKLRKAVDYTFELCDVLLPSRFNSALMQGYCRIIAEQASKILRNIGTPYRVEFRGSKFRFFNGRTWVEASYASGGQKVLTGLSIRLAIFQLVGGSNSFFLLDEPSAGLDRDNIQLLASLLDSIPSIWPWCQMVVVTHDRDLIVPGSLVLDLGEREFIHAGD